MKKILLAVLLIFAMLLSCACACTVPGSEPEEGNGDAVAYVPENDVVRPTGATSGYGCALTDDPAKDKEIWDWAEKCFDEWYVRYQEILRTPDPEVNEIRSDNSPSFDQLITAYNTQLGSKDNDYKGIVKTRTLSSLKDFTPVETEFDEYGGWVNEAMRREATGHFYTAKIGDRWYLIDPLGYPTIIRGVSGLTYQYSGSKKQEATMLARYGTGEKWGIAVTRVLSDDLYINACTILAPGSKYINVADRLCYQDKLRCLSAYETANGSRNTTTSSGSCVLIDGMHVFDPAWVTAAEEHIKSRIGETPEFLDDPYFIGYATDNELPVEETTMGLTTCMKLDYSNTKYDNRYSYAAAWTFLARMTGKENPSLSDVTDELKELYKGYVYDRYYSVIEPLYREYVPNKLLMGSRALNSIRTSEWIARFTAYWCDVITINWYKEWTPKQKELNDLCYWCNKPIMITEYFVTSSDCKMESYNCPIKAIQYTVNSQEDRAKGYENYFLRLLECQNCVGFYWFDSIDADSETASNKGVFASDQTLYEELAASMHNIGKNIYGLAQYFDSKY